jgi:hypothetical protein
VISLKQSRMDFIINVFRTHNGPITPPTLFEKFLPEFCEGRH